MIFASMTVNCVSSRTSSSGSCRVCSAPYISVRGAPTCSHLARRLRIGSFQMATAFLNDPMKRSESMYCQYRSSSASSAGGGSRAFSSSRFLRNVSRYCRFSSGSAFSGSFPVLFCDSPGRISRGVSGGTIKSDRLTFLPQSVAFSPYPVL